MRKAHQSSAVSADPQVAGAVRQQGADFVAAQAGYGVLIEECEMNAIEARQAALSAQPQIAVRSLGNGKNRTLRKARIGLPSAMNVLCQRFGRVQAGARR